MKKIKFLGLISLVTMFICGCSCAKVDESTYSSAVDTYKSTDGISFTRVEDIVEEGQQVYTRKIIKAKYNYDSVGNVTEMEYSIDSKNINSIGGVLDSEIIQYYYQRENKTLYTNFGSVNKYKETDVEYNFVFNANVCQDSQCYMMIKGNYAPVYKLNEISNFSIEKQDKKAVANFSAVCYSHDNCASSSQEINYTYVIGANGNIESISYVVVNENKTHTIKYTFHSYGSNNVKVTFPDDLANYIEK